MMSNHGKNAFVFHFYYDVVPKKIDIDVISTWSKLCVETTWKDKYSKKPIVGIDLDRSKKYYNRKGTYDYKLNFATNILYRPLCFQLIKVLIN